MSPYFGDPLTSTCLHSIGKCYPKCGMLSEISLIWNKNIFPQGYFVQLKYAGVLEITVNHLKPHSSTRSYKNENLNYDM